MLAKELKISNYWKQRNFIERKLKALLLDKIGDACFTYHGYLFPEVRQYFESEGFRISMPSEENYALRAKNNGRFTYFFYPKDDIVLSEEDVEKSQENCIDCF